MKHPEIKMSLEGLESPVDSVQDWLNQELEQRGIDGRVYTRFVISLLRDGDEPEGSECEDFWDHKKAPHSKKVEKQRRPASQGQEDPRKLAAVNCLLSLTDSKVGITSLVDELIRRLNSSSEGAVYAPLHVELEREKEVESADPTEKYYAAFPALTGETTPAVSPSSAEGDNIWCRKPLASQLAGETHEKQDTYPNGIGSEAGDIPPGKRGSSENHSVKRVRPNSSDRRSFEPKPCKNGRKKNSIPGKKRPSMESLGGGAPAGSWPHDRGAPQSVAANMLSAESEGMRNETCMQIEGILKEMLFRNQRMVANQSAEPSAGRRGLNPSPELQENDQWYKRPLEEFFMHPSLPTERLYKRNSYPPHCSSLQDAPGYQGVSSYGFFDSPIQADTMALLKTALMNDDPSLISALPDYDSGKDSAVVSDGDLSSGEEEQAKEKTPSIEICFAAHLLQSRRNDVAKSLSSSLEVACTQLDEEDSSREPSLGSQEEETIFHLELDENEMTPAQHPRGENPIDTASVSQPGKQVLEAYSSAGTFGKDECLEVPQHCVAPLQEMMDHIFETVQDLGYSSEHLRSFVEEPLANGIDTVIEDTAAENQLETPAQDGIPSPADCLPACLRNDLAAGEKSAQSGAAGACLPAYMWNALIDGEKFPEDATSFCPASSLLPTRDWSAWSESPLGLGLFSTLRPCSRTCIEPAFHGCLNFNGLPLLDSSLLSMFSDYGPVEPSSLLPTDNWPLTTTSQDPPNPWSRPGPSYDWNGRQSFSPGILCKLDAPMRWSTGAGGDLALRGGGNEEGNIWSPSAEKPLGPLWDVNLSRKAAPGWSIWSNIGISLPLSTMDNYSQQESKLSSTSQSPDADDTSKTESEKAGPSYSLFPNTSKLEEDADNDWPGIFLYYYSIVGEGGLVCYNHVNGLSKSCDLIPSKNSAFRPYLKGNKSLLHVRSTPNMKFSFSDKKKDQENSNSDVSGEHLLLTRYFRPIQTPPSTPEDELEFRPNDLFGGYTSQGSQYQRYRDPKKANPVEEFQPQFKVQKNLDKYIQTSLDDKEETPSAATMAMSGTYHHDPFSSRKEPGNSTDAFHDADGQMEEPLEEQMTQASFEPKEVPAEPWMDSRNIKQGSISQQSEGRSRGNSILGFSSHIWSNGYDHDQDLQASGAEFPVTPLLSVSSTQSYSEPLAQGQAALEDDVFYPVGVSYYQEARESQSRPPEAMQTDEYRNHLAPIPDQAVYSSDLERQWQSETSEARQSKTLSRTKSAKTSTIKKPCSYYIEGRCQRSECKFSHDLSTITCRFWLENKCFKGEHCPFLHGFASEAASPPQSQAATASPEFSERDFPVLGRNGRNVGHPEK